MIQFSNVTVTEGSREILKAVNLSISPAERVVITGPSGSGKSTLLLTLLGVYSQTSGSISFKGSEISPYNIQKIRSEIAFIGQEPYLGADTGKDALLLPFSYRAHRENKPNPDEIDHVLNSLNLSHHILKQYSQTLSGGEKQRIAIARALLLKKKVFLLDEITSALDSESIKAVIQLFRNPDFTLLSVSHEANWIDFCDRKLKMDLGSLIELKIPKEVDHGSH